MSGENYRLVATQAERQTGFEPSIRSAAAPDGPRLLRASDRTGGASRCRKACLDSRAMKQSTLLTAVSSIFAIGLIACGPSYEPDRVMTPEERLQEQERLAYEAELEQTKHGDDSEIELEDEDEVKAFDEKQAEMEVRRATLSAATCPETQPKAPKGTGEVTIVFVSDGTVRDATINSPFSGTPIEECVLMAYKSIIVPPFRESEHTMNWKVDLTGKKKDLMPKEDDPVAEALSGGKKTECKDGKDKDGKPCKEEKADDKKKKKK
jgi:hypothetical protein